MMKSLATWTGVVLFALLFSIGTLTMAQESQTNIKKVPIQRTSAASGEEMFDAYCAACHGKDAKGDGPAAVELKVPPPDLTTLAQRHGGKYPSAYVDHLLHNGVAEAKAHGSDEMPVWGDLFSSIAHGGGGRAGSGGPEVTKRVYNLNKYIESLQGK
jgi:mono/diheme cytochrome c family protein